MRHFFINNDCVSVRFGNMHILFAVFYCDKLVTYTIAGLCSVCSVDQTVHQFVLRYFVKKDNTHCNEK